ncbi:MAG: hypothetical protein J7M27_04610, partial [Candidatus Latescibacteria bacterium]|nr:hypothetical protein [Candidatus Latescibacterota bacterium]
MKNHHKNLWFCLLFVAFSGVFTYAAYADITGITVTLEDNTADTNTKYTVEFTTGAQVPKNGRIRITFPAGTGIPGTWSAAAVHVNGVGASTVTTSDSTVIIKVNENIPAGTITTIVGVETDSLTNPTTPSSGNTVTIETRTQGNKNIEGPTTSTKPYTIISGTAITGGYDACALSDSTVSAVSSYRLIPILDDALSAGDSIHVSFPSGTSIPPTMSTSDVTIKPAGGSEQNPSAVAVDQGNRRISLKLSSGISGSVADTITFSSSAHIGNPSTSGSSYQIGVSTTLQPTAGASRNYSIENSSTLTKANVTPNPSTLNTVAEYTLAFSTGNSGAFGPDSTITIVFPENTTVPTTIDIQNVTVGGADAKAVTTTPAARQVAITTPGAIGDNGSVTVIFKAAAGIKNPTTAGSSYTLTVHTTAEPADVASNAYEITASTVTTPHVTLSSSQPSTENVYTLSFNTGAGGALSAGSSTITVDFDDSTGVSSTIPASSITVKGTACSVSPSINTTTGVITITTPVAVSDNGSVEVVFNEGITNPSAHGDYTLTARTSEEATGVTSNSYTITTATSVSGVAVSADDILAGATAYYTVDFTSNSSFSDKDKIYITFPSSFSVPDL